MNSDELLMGMRTGEPQPLERITAFVQGITDGSISRPQAAAWLTHAFVRGLTDAETIALTQAMTHSGTVMKWSDGPTLIDKHSTGGVGDKVSLILAPLWAELGLRVPMISGRGLGHTGGTLDKLESIVGYRTDLSNEELAKQLAEVGCFVSGQTATLAPADRVLYALRNETCTVESVPLIVGSILSKKIAEGVGRLVLDVKTGSGAFMKTLEDSRSLANALVRVANGAGVQTTAVISAMDRPLGRAIGNALEVTESVACLQGGGPEDLRQLVVALADHPQAEAVLASGRAYERFERMVAAQGGEIAGLRDPSKLHGAGVESCDLTCEQDGWMRWDALGIGRAAFVLGAGRRHAEDPVDFGVGIELLVAHGEKVEVGQPVLRLHHRNGRSLSEATLLAKQAAVVEDAFEPSPLVVDLITKETVA